MLKPPALLLAMSSLAACGAVTTDALDQDLTCPVPTIVTERSLAITDPETLGRFPLARVLEQIARTGRSTVSVPAMFSTWMSTFADCANPAIDPNGYGLVCPRDESELAAIDPGATAGPRFVPVALTNRFDLAPTNGVDCGEYRIVYALVESPADRAFLIFEGRLRNPVPASGLAGCTPVADFWAGLSNDPSSTSRARKLERFYFTGHTEGGVAFPPVVTAASYGFATSDAPRTKGQVRTNMFVNGREWQLREFKLAKPCAASAACAVAFEHVTVKTNPAEELFAGFHANAPAFQAEFLDQVPTLSNPMSTIAMTTSNRFNEFESISQLGVRNVVYKDFASIAFRAQIQARITNPQISVENLLDRATTQTCAGCHQHSNNAPLGNGETWPTSLLFVHIDEGGRLSDALTTLFLPRRATVLRSFLTSQCAGVATIADGRTIGGGDIDAAN